MSTDSPGPPESEQPSLPPAPTISTAELAPATGGNRRMLLIGLLAGVAGYAAILVGSVLFGGERGYWALPLIGLMLLLTLVVMIGGIVLVVVPRTRMLGAGLLIAVAAGLFVDAGACIALLQAGV